MKIAIVGGGFSALSLAYQIITKAVTYSSESPYALYIFEPKDKIGLGTAYSTPYPWHLLNVRANHMGIDFDHPEGFFRWLQQNEHIWRCIEAPYSALDLDTDAFLPRKLYGIYLSAMLEQLQKIATTKSIHFERTPHRAQDILDDTKNSLKVIFDDHQSLNVDKVILATSVHPLKKLSFTSLSNRFIQNIWDLDRTKLKDYISRSSKNTTMLIIGTGLTMVDMVTSLNNMNFPGKILAFSLHGQLPEPHHEKYLPPLGNLDHILAPKSLLAKVRAFRNELKEIEANGGSWIQLFETLRPVTAKLWKQLSIQDQKRFLRHCLSLWNKHRHRMPLESKHLLDKLIQEGRLKILGGKIISIQENSVLDIRYVSKNNQIIETFQVDYAFNCSGPNYLISHSNEPLIQNLLNRKEISPDRLGLGIKCNSNFSVEGPYSNRIFAMGSLLFGEDFETTAVPDIRKHAHKIASEILQNV